MQKTFNDFFKKISPQKILITAHQNADPDALCSAFAITALIEQLHPKVKTVVSFDGVSIIAEKIIKSFNLNLIPPSEIKSDATIIVDANSAEQLGSLNDYIEWEQPVFMIDHHVSNPKSQEIAQYMIIDSNSVATTELIFEIFQSLDVVPTEKTATLLFLGILYDSRHLLLAKNKTFFITNQLIEPGVNYSDMIDLLTISMDRPERIARLKAAQRLEIHEFNGWLVALSHSSAYEASACRAIIRLGADVALVYGKTKEGIRISGRATSAIAKQTTLNLATDVMAKIGPIMHGEGGGHNTAAGCSGKDNLEAGLELALKLLEEKLSQKA